MASGGPVAGRGASTATAPAGSGRRSGHSRDASEVRGLPEMKLAGLESANAAQAMPQERSIGAASRPKRNNTDFRQAQDSATQSAVIAARNWRP